MNQKGEVTLLSIMLLIGMMSILTLQALKLRQSMRLLQKRNELFLCVKESKGELNKYLKFMGRTNWGIKNVRRASLIMAFIPGLQGGALQAEKVKKILIQIQNLSLIPYLKKIKDLKAQGCPIDPRMLITPFEINPKGYARDSMDAARLRNKRWSYYFVSLPYALKLEVDSNQLEAIGPRIFFQASESAEKLSSLWSSPY